MTKKRIITSIEKVSREVRDLISEAYPMGWVNNVWRINKPNGEFFHAITLETDEVAYLIKVAVKVDSKADLEKEDRKGYGINSGDDESDDNTDDVADDSSGQEDD